MLDLYDAIPLGTTNVVIFGVSSAGVVIVIITISLVLALMCWYVALMLYTSCVEN